MTDTRDIDIDIDIDIDATPGPWRYAPGARGGLLVAVVGIAALVVVNQVAVETAVDGDSSRGLTTAAAVIGFLVVAFVARLVPLGDHPLRRDVGRRFGATVYLSALAAALVAILVGDILLTGFCVVGLALLAGLVVTRRVAARDEMP